MSLLDTLLGQAGNLNIAGIAQQAGIDPNMAQQAVSALAAAHNQPGDTVDTAAQASGIDAGTLNSVVGALGGHEGLGNIVQIAEQNPQLLQGILGAVTGAAGSGGIGGLLGGLASAFFNKQQQ
ncbi:MAG: hypothetical protein JSS36_03725 [Proteobacteria bacterium]|nr:hypothetical protein [Pseudomonadota bacterium]